MLMLRFFVFIISFISFTVSDASAFRCGTNLLTAGCTKKQVRNACGKPSFTETVCADDENNVLVQKKKKSKKCKKKVERWHYNCGEGDFIYILTFEKSILTGETTAGRGHGSSDCLGSKLRKRK